MVNPLGMVQGVLQRLAVAAPDSFLFLGAPLAKKQSDFTVRA